MGQGSGLADQFAGGSGFPVYDCQWPGCRNIASHRIRRSIHLRWITVCEKHMLTFRELLDTEAFRVLANHTPQRCRIVGTRVHVGWS